MIKKDSNVRNIILTRMAYGRPLKWRPLGIIDQLETSRIVFLFHDLTTTP